MKYDTAIALLQSRYADQGMIVRELMDSLLGAPSMQRDNLVSLRRLFITFSEKVQGLRNVGVKEGWFFLSHVLLRKLDAETKRSFDVYLADFQHPLPLHLPPLNGTVSTMTSWLFW